MKAISLFSGVGGFDIGFERAGIETVLQAEQDPWCLEVLARHWPQTERVTDVRDVRGGAGIDLIYGGFPCQDVSVAGKRAGLGGERSGLWFEFERILSELRPRWAVIENVPGLLSSNKGRDFAVILDGLEDLGYSVGWAVLDAQNFGVPQRRRRVFVVAGPTRRSVEQVLSLCESCGGNPETSAAPGQAVAGTLGGGAGERGWSPDTDRMTFIPIGVDGSDIGFALRAGASHSGDKGDGGMNTTVVADRMTFVPEIAWALQERDAKGADSDTKVGHLLPQHAGGVRRLTPLECERLMGWPDDWTRWTAGGKEIADSHRYRMAGNGVVASVAEWLGHRIVAVDADLGQVSIPIKTPWYLTEEALAAAIAQEVAWAKETK